MTVHLQCTTNIFYHPQVPVVVTSQLNRHPLTFHNMIIKVCTCTCYVQSPYYSVAYNSTYYQFIQGVNHINYLIFVYKFTQTAKFAKIIPHKNFLLYGISKNDKYVTVIQYKIGWLSQTQTSCQVLHSADMITDDLHDNPLCREPSPAHMQISMCAYLISM